MGRGKKTKPHGDPHTQIKRSPNHKIKETSWPNLPQRLIKHISNNPTTLRTINFGLATKSWKLNTPTTRHNNMMIKHSSPDHQTTPQTRLGCTAESAPRQPLFCDVEFHREHRHCAWHERKRRYLIQYHFDGRYTGCSHGVVIGRAASDSSHLYYFCPLDRSFGNILDLPGHVLFGCAALTSVRRSYPDRSCVIMVATGISSPAFVYSRLNVSLEWTELDCSVNDPNYGSPEIKKSASPMRFTNMIGFEGKFYALSCQGTLAVVEQVGDGDSNDRFEVTALGKTRAVPSVPFRGFKECLIESDGDVLLVLLASTEAKTEFDLVEVYRLRFEDLSWIKKKSLGERTLFVGNDCCVSVCAEKVGCRGNCVYFTQRGSDVWFEFDMEFGGISRAWTDRAISSSGNPLEWDEPVMSREELEQMITYI